MIFLFVFSFVKCCCFCCLCINRNFFIFVASFFLFFCVKILFVDGFLGFGFFCGVVIVCRFVLLLLLLFLFLFELFGGSDLGVG